MIKVREKVQRERGGRSYVMSRIRSKDTGPELVVRRWLYAHGYRYRKNDRRLPGTPDVVMRKYGVCIFVHGCFWHAHDHVTFPRTHADFWRNKLETNRRRDAESKRRLMHMGWNVITVWECQLKPRMVEQTMRGVERWINHSLLIKRGAVFGSYAEAQPYAPVPDEDMGMVAEPLPGYPARG